ncbi:MAG: DUF2148 domain-containing protein [Bacteroidales bacterium]|nr:DUF2148 domain-containing protein [Bacteroidales bacterium]
MVVNEKEINKESIIAIAKNMMIAARTAPKACGVDNLEIVMISETSDISILAEKMREISQNNGQKFFLRDAGNIESSQAVIFIGSKSKVQALNCGLCGFTTCEEKNINSISTPCVFNTHDLGLAVGSAVSMASDFKIDNRVMYSAGVAAKELNWLSDCFMVIAIPLSATGKNPFFDRKSTRPANCCQD